MINKQKRVLIICGSIFLALTILYLAVISPLTKPEDEIIEAPELVQGEILGPNNRVYLFPPAQRADVSELTVENKDGEFTFYQKGGTFYIKDMETAPYDLELFSQIFVSMCSPLSLKRIVLEDGVDLTQYGLDENASKEEDRPQGVYTVVTEDKKTHRVIVGKKIPTGGGYYCMYEGRDVVYVLSNSIALGALSDVYSLITPTLGMPVEQSEYGNVKKLSVIKNGVPLFETESFSPDENGTAGTDSASYSYEFTLESLKGFNPEITTFTMVVQACSSLAGSETVATGVSLDVDAIKKDYGIDINNPHFAVSYTLDDENCTIIFSEPDKDGICHAYSSFYHIVVKIPTSSIIFYDYNIAKYVDAYIFKYDIRDIAKVEFAGQTTNQKGEAVSIDNSFGLYNPSNSKDSEVGEQQVWNISTNKHYDKDEINNFRVVLRSMAEIRIVNIEENVDTSKAKLISTISVTNDDGEKTTAHFYAYSSTRCYVTINDELDALNGLAFYVQRDIVETFLRNVDLFNNGNIIADY